MKPVGLKILIRGAGEMASGVGLRLFKSHFTQILFTETDRVLCVRRSVSFCEALFQERTSVEGVESVRVNDITQVGQAWASGCLAVLVDPEMTCLPRLNPDVIVDAVLAKKNLGLRRDQAELVVALGPGFTAGEDADVVVETNRGHNLGRLIYQGRAEPNTGLPGDIARENVRRVLRAPAAGILETGLDIGAKVVSGQTVAEVGGRKIISELDGLLRGLIRPGTLVWPGLKVGDIDPRGRIEYCRSVSDKARALGGAVLEAILHRFNR